MDRSSLRQLINQYFNESELKDIFFDLDFDYESVKGSGKSDTVREFIQYCERNGELENLLHVCYRMRPHVEWPSISASDNESENLSQGMPTLTEEQKLEQAIAALESQRTQMREDVLEAALAPLYAQLRTIRGSTNPLKERKLVTVLFADLSGFTALSEKLDVEDVSETMNALWKQLDLTITVHNGRIDKHMGDGLMALFGVPISHEDDPERAIYAALEMMDEFAQFRKKYNLPTEIRIGINTGQVVLGPVGTIGEYTAMGNAVNLASRLEEAAPLGSILISQQTYQHVRGVFDVLEQDPILVKGKQEPIQTYVILQAKEPTFRVVKRGVEGVETQMIGRKAEFNLLQNAFYDILEDNERQLITILGDAGIGKSRLLYEFDNWIESKSEIIHCYKGRANQETQNLPYSLIRNIFTFQFGIQDNDSAIQARNKFESGIVEMSGESKEGQMQAHFIGHLLSFDFSQSPYIQTVLDDPKQLRDRAIAYLVDYFKAVTTHRPTVILLEDIHWADDSSLDVLNTLALATAGRHLLIICTSRPHLFERRPHWGEGHSFFSELRIRRLSRRQSRSLVNEILQRVDDIPDTLRQLIVEKAEGNPFFIEELIKMLIEEGVIEKEEPNWIVKESRLREVPIPATMTGVLQARLDSLSQEERNHIQCASVVGQTFWNNAINYIISNPTNTVDKTAILDESITEETLARLRSRELIFKRETSSFQEAQEYAFKHSFLREVTYESVLKRIRSQYHALVAEWLIQNSGERATEYMGLIAEHLELAGQDKQAINFLEQAGKQAFAQFANNEAKSYYSRALSLIDDTKYIERYNLLLCREQINNLQGNREEQEEDLEILKRIADRLARVEGTIQQKIEVAIRQSNFYEVTDNYVAATETAKHATELAQNTPFKELEARGYLHWGRALWRQGNYEEAYAKLEKALSEARSFNLSNLEAECLRNLGAVRYYQGNYSNAKKKFEQALGISRESKDRLGEGLALNNLGVISVEQNDFVGIRKYFERSLQIYRETGDRWSESIALNNLGNVALDIGDWEKASNYFEQVLRLSLEIGNLQGEALALGNLGKVFRAVHSHMDALQCFEQSLQIRQDIGDLRGEGAILNNLGSVYLGLGDYAKAKKYLSQALENYRKIDDQRGLSEVLAYQSLLHVHLGDDQLAHHLAQEALDIIHDLGNRSSEGLVQLCLGHTLTRLGNVTEAIQAYQDAYTLRQELGQTHFATEILASMASVSLKLGSRSSAINQIEQVLKYIKDRGLKGMYEPFTVYENCYQILDANQDARSKEVLTLAYQALRTEALQIDNQELRNVFLSSNRYILETVNNIGDTQLKDTLIS